MYKEGGYGLWWLGKIAEKFLENSVSKTDEIPLQF